MCLGLSYDFTFFQYTAECGSCLYLALVRSHLLDTIHERIKTSVESFKRNSGNEVGFLAQSERFQDGINTVGAHELCTVQQSQSFFTFQFYRLPAKFIEYTDGFASLTFIIYISHTDKRQEKVGKRSKIAGCT